MHRHNFDQDCLYDCLTEKLLVEFPFPVEEFRPGAPLRREKVKQDPPGLRPAPGALGDAGKRQLTDAIDVDQFGAQSFVVEHHPV